MKSIDSSLVRVRIAGLGRSGWDMHADAMSKLPDKYRIVAAADADTERRREASERFGCATYADFDLLVGDPDAELIVVATPSHLHVPQVMQALRSGRHVVCEKPLAKASAEVAQMVESSTRVGRILAPFQNRRYDPMFCKVREVIESGVLGRIVQIRAVVHSFGRRWDWQTLREFGGGQLNNTGSHFVDLLLQLFGPAEPKIACWMDRALASGDAEDHVKVILHAQGAPLIDLEISSACAYPQPMWLVMGTSGGLRSEGRSLQWKSVDFSTMPPRPVERQAPSGRAWGGENLEWREESWTTPEEETIPRMTERFYEDLYKTLRRGAPLVVTPQSVQRQIAVLEQCHKMCA